VTPALPARHRGAPPNEEPPYHSLLAIASRLAEQEDEGKALLLLRDLRHRVSLLTDEQRSALEFGETPARQIDVAIMTVVNAEQHAIMKVFNIDPREYTKRHGQRFWEFSVPCRTASSGSLRCVLAQIKDTGNPKATRAGVRLLRSYSPEACFLVGIAAGIKGRVRLGDVVTPDNVHYYEPECLKAGGSEPRHEKHREPWRMYHNVSYYSQDHFRKRLVGALRDVDKADLPSQFNLSKFTPALHSERTTLACGELLLEDGEFLKALKEQHDSRIRAADTEGYGFAVAFDGVASWAIFRGISDFGAHPRPTNWQYIAAFAAGIALRDFLETEYEAVSNSAL
jgi:nucleoside phosphorylase